MRRRPGHKIIFCGDEPAQHQPVGLPQPIREGSCFACDIIKEPRASTMQRCNIETTSLHYLLNANDAVVQVMDAVLFRLPAVERARLYALMGARFLAPLPIHVPIHQPSGPGSHTLCTIE